MIFWDQKSLGYGEVYYSWIEDRIEIYGTHIKETRKNQIIINFSLYCIEINFMNVIDVEFVE